MSSYKNTVVEVWPGVFHPGIFHSTHFLLDYLLKQNLKQQSLLELGCGSGLISVIAAKNGAVVTASDISESAIANTKTNADRNQVAIEAIHSDLLANIPRRTFDWIVINPPYYAADATTEEQFAWNAGENFEYFRELFSSLANFQDAETKIIMVLTLGTDIGKISAIADSNGFAFEKIAERKMLFDKRDFIFRIRANK